MSGTPTIKLAGPVDSVELIDSTLEGPQSFEVNIEGGTAVEPETLKQQYAQAIQALQATAKKLQVVCNRMIVEHRQAIAKLAVEIARKILAQKVQEGDYKIETIVQEALNNSPTRQDIVVRLNPQDLSRLQQIQGDSGTFDGVKFVADAGIGPAQCVIETPKGKVESLIEEHLEQVSRALGKAI